MTYEIANEIANGNTKLLHALFIELTKMAIDSGLSLDEAKHEAKAMLDIMANTYLKTNIKFNN